MDKIFLVNDGRVTEVEIEKETDKMYLLRGNDAYKRNLRKTEVGVYKGQYHRRIFSFNREEAIEKYNEGLNAEIEQKRKEMENLKEYLIK